MPRVVIRRVVSADLLSLFTQLEPVTLEPTSISDEASYVIDILPGTHRFREATEVDVIAAAAAVTVQIPVTPIDTYDYVFACGLQHSDVASHRLEIALLQPVTGTRVPLVTSQDTLISGTSMGGVGFVKLAPNRPFLIPGGWQLDGVADTMGVGGQLRLFAAFVRHSTLDPHPKI